MTFNKIFWSLGIALAIGCFALPALAAPHSPVGFSIGDLAGDFVKEKVSGRMWYIDVNSSRRYQITENDQGLFERLKSAAKVQTWPAIKSVIDVADPSKRIAKGPLRGLVYDENAPELLWHVQRRAYRRQALRSSQDILQYAKNAMTVDDAALKEYPIAFADFDYAMSGPIKIASASNATSTQSGKSIKISLKEQRLYAFENGKLINTFLISSGVRAFSTPIGEFSVMEKVPVVDYVWSYGAGNPNNYDLGNVPYNLRIMPHKYIHYAYWHNNFGHVMSHGCVNVNLANIKWIYRWADQGIPVKII
ncbi:MAG: L,D-transpeptidase [Patescibacteria group bacterium]|jgi:lipoprotein-anchoring transpeptidase ErfK/SrfK